MFQRRSTTNRSEAATILYQFFVALLCQIEVMFGSLACLLLKRVKDVNSLIEVATQMTRDSPLNAPKREFPEHRAPRSVSSPRVPDPLEATQMDRSIPRGPHGIWRSRSAAGSGSQLHLDEAPTTLRSLWKAAIHCRQTRKETALDRKKGAVRPRSRTCNVLLRSEGASVLRLRTLIPRPKSRGDAPKVTNGRRIGTPCSITGVRSAPRSKNWK